MYKENRLPQSAAEGIIFMLVISFISVNTIAPIIMFMEIGLNLQTYVEFFKIMPVMWIIVILLVRFAAGPLIGKIMPKFQGETDGFNARILLNIVMNVTILSLTLTVIGTWVGSREISADIFTRFFPTWFRNFGIAFWIEVIVAQPIARFVMVKIHENKAGKIAS